MLSIPLDEVRRRDPASGAVAVGDGTFFPPLSKEQQRKIIHENGTRLGRPLNPSIIYHFRKSCKKIREFPLAKTSPLAHKASAKQTVDN